MEIRKDEIRLKIQEERRNVDLRKYSHNIVSLLLRQLSVEFSDGEANKAIRDFKLNKLGWREQSVSEE